MNRYDIALGKIPSLGSRVSKRFYSHKLLEALCATGKDPLMGDVELFEQYEGTDLSFWHKCFSNQEPNELGKMIMSIRDIEQYRRTIDQALTDEMAKAAGMSDEVCNDPDLCTNCPRNDEWPKCMKDIKLRGYHPIHKDNWDEVVECSNCR